MIAPHAPFKFDCTCPKFTHKTRSGDFLVSHTYSCLMLRRGNRSLTEYYGEPATSSVNL